MKFSQFSQTLKKLEEEASRNEITVILGQLFKEVSVEEIDKAVYLSLGVLAPSFKGIIFNLADKMVIRAIAKAYDKSSEEVTKLYKKSGDLGIVADELAQKLAIINSHLTINDVYTKLLEIAREGGEGSQERRIDKLAELLNSVDSLSAKYITRIPIGKLRLGFSDLTIVDALSWYEKGDKSGKAQLTSAYQVISDIGLLAKNVKHQGIEKTAKTISPKLGIPVMPMLAQIINGPEEMVKKMGDVLVEPKLDGVRLAIHWRKDLVKVFTRNMNETSAMFPELANLSRFVKAHEIILDCEAVGINEETLKMVDFQVTMQRRRKHDIGEFSTKIPLRFNIFDILYKDGENLMQLPYEKRREILTKTINDPKGELLKIVEFIKTSDPKVISQKYLQEIKNGFEGIMVKKADSLYIPGRTGWRWVKMKKKESAEGKLSDTIDAIVMGYTSGQGKRIGFGVGQFLVGIRDGQTIKTVTKVGTGLTDDQFRELKTRLSKITVNEKPKEYEVSKVLFPDFWVEPKLVVELAGDDITKSPNHTAGYALRFPRLVKFRDDKTMKEATELQYFEKLFTMQKRG